MMSEKFGRRLIPSGDAVASPVGDETIILQLKNGTYFGLDPVGTRVWQLLNEGLSPAAICVRLGEEFDATPDVLEADVRRFLVELEASEIIAEDAAAGE